VSTTESNSTPTSQADREIVLTRVFDAPRELVFATWTDAKHLQAWWGVKSFKITTLSIDVRPGGAWRFVMEAADGTKWDNRMVFREIVKNERIVYDHDSDKDEDPARFQVTVTFAEQAGKTKLTMRSVFPTAAQRAAVIGFGAIEIGKLHLEGLAEYVAKLGAGG
jgi:uncharacterized protein YndB with AHSA1/START domain